MKKNYKKGIRENSNDHFESSNSVSYLQSSISMMKPNSSFQAARMMGMYKFLFENDLNSKKNGFLAKLQDMKDSCN